ncbi:MAG TPA: hypothetical protein VGO67_05265 [Verrucomicrobiae bacterium]
MTKIYRTFVRRVFHFLMVSCLMAFALATDAATIWDGPEITFLQPAPKPTEATNQDRITTNVWLTRASSKGLFNAFSETNAISLSPAGTEWAFGGLSNYASLSFTNWNALLNGASPTTLVGQEMVLHLTDDDIYIGIEITIWGSGGSGGFAYERTTPVINASAASISGENFSFNYNADPGLEYIVQSSTNLVDWISVATNSGAGGTAAYSNTVIFAGSGFYRVVGTASP